MRNYKFLNSASFTWNNFAYLTIIIGQHQHEEKTEISWLVIWHWVFFCQQEFTVGINFFVKHL